MVFDVNFGHGKRTRRPKSENDVEKRSEDQEPTEVDFALVKIHGLVETDEGVSKRTTNKSGAERAFFITERMMML